jgi:hypothetical protein
MRSVIITASVGLVLGLLPIAALDGTLQQTSIPYNSEALRAAIADGLSRAGATVASAEEAVPDSQH